MAEPPLEISYNTEFDSLVKALSGVKRPGEFYASGTMEIPMPTLSIDEVGVVSFPVPAFQSQELVARAAVRAPYGRGAETLVDESVRKVWQIEPGKIRLSGNGWGKGFERLVAEVAEKLGCEPGSVDAEFYKMLVYDTGGFFMAHRDSEKAGGMFGTLVVTLPSAHEGGALVVRHAGQEVELNLHVADAGEIRYAAFYADCEHEVRPITSGYRIGLIFNLLQRPGSGSGSLQPPDDRNTVLTTTKILKKWVSASAPEKLVYLLEHQYTQGGLSFDALKNADAALAKILKKAAQEAGCALHLAIVHIEESGTANYSGDYYGRGRYRYDDDDPEENDSDYEIEEVCNWNRYLNEWRASDGKPIDFGKIPLGENELLPPGALDDEEPDNIHFSEATGNAGAEFERTYLRAALVLWPLARFDEICLSAGMDAALGRLEQLVTPVQEQGDAPNPADFEAAGKSIDRLAGLIVQRWAVNDWRSGSLLARFLDILARSRRVKFIREIFESILSGGYDGTQNEPIARCATLLPPKEAGEHLAKLATRHVSNKPGPCIDLWVRLALHTQNASALEEIALALTARPIKGKGNPKPIWGSWASLYGWHENRKAAGTAAESNLPTMTPELVAAFLAGLQEHRSYAGLEAAVECITQSPEAFEPGAILLPALKSSFSAPAKGRLNEFTARALWSHCVTFYLSRSGTPPLAPKDWSQKVAFAATTADAKELAKFAQDPEATVHHFKVRKDRRQDLHRLIERSGLDMTHVTDRRTNPQTLVCTKTRASYQHACKVYEKDLTAMRQLASLAEKNHPSVPERLSTLKEALRKGGASPV